MKNKKSLRRRRERNCSRIRRAPAEEKTDEELSKGMKIQEGEELLKDKKSSTRRRTSRIRKVPEEEEEVLFKDKKSSTRRPSRIRKIPAEEEEGVLFKHKKSSKRRRRKRIVEG